MQDLQDSQAGKLDESRVTMLKDITEAGYAVDARQMNAGLGGSFANLQQEMFANTYMLSGGTEIPSNADLNEYKDVGNYYCMFDSIAGTLPNCPAIQAFVMKVECSTGIDYPSQMIREYDSGTLYYRVFKPGMNAWMPWRKFGGTVI